MSLICSEICDRSARLRQQILEDKESFHQFSEQLDISLKSLQKKQKETIQKSEGTDFFGF